MNLQIQIFLQKIEWSLTFLLIKFLHVFTWFYILYFKEFLINLLIQSLFFWKYFYNLIFNRFLINKEKRTKNQEFILFKFVPFIKIIRSYSTFFRKYYFFNLIRHYYSFEIIHLWFDESIIKHYERYKNCQLSWMMYLIDFFLKRKLIKVQYQT